uniref:FLYWCH-type domain-containing protein n=1 Tax=Meloidogyne incognita TaxID=6306 RepID=A0A914NWF4_MELIC
MFNGILSLQNKEKLSHDGYIYVMDKPSADGEKIFWRCDTRKTTECKGRIHTTADEERSFLRMVTAHSCSGLGDPARVGVQKVDLNYIIFSEFLFQVMSVIRQRGASTMEKPAQIRAAAVQNL